MALFAAPLLLGASKPTELEVRVEKLRSDRGAVRLCLTRDSNRFPNCKADPNALKFSAPATQAKALHLSGLAPGEYALSIIHDENKNGRLDTFARIPREGFGFSRNPGIRFGPPRFNEVRFNVGSGHNEQIVRLNYLL